MNMLVEIVNYYQWMFFITLALFLISLYIIYDKGFFKKSISEIPLKEEEDPIKFSPLEMTIIQLIIEKSNTQQYFTVNELNLHLGVKNKSIEIQKKIRTEAIIRINHKFNVNCQMDTVFIERVRSIEDRRYFNYYINDENAKMYRNTIA
jgi:hypothetical protein